MQQELHQRLRPIQERMHRMSMLRAAVRALMIGSVMASALAILRLLGVQISWLTVALVPLAMTGSALALSSIRKPTWVEVARQVDQTYALKDRTLTAICFSEQSEPVALQQLQIDDALGCLSSIAANQVVPRVLPSSMPVACLMLIFSWLLLVLPLASQKVVAEPDPPTEQLLRLADDLEQEIVGPLRRLNEQQEQGLDQEDRQAVNDLANDLAEMARELKLSGVDSREALAKLSDMQTKIAEAQQQFDLSKIDVNMREMGQILQRAEATRQAGQALEELDYQAAAERLDELQPESITAREKADVAPELESLANRMTEQQQDKLAAATDEFAESMKDDQPSQTESQRADQKASASELANMSRRFAARKALARSLAKQKAKLNEAKGVARSGGKSTQPTKQPRRTWGRGAAPDSLMDQPTELNSQRQRENISGVAGDGPSEREVVESSQAEDAKELEYSQQYQRFQRAAESVLEQEELPLGHRQTIRDYFEAIRPE